MICTELPESFVSKFIPEPMSGCWIWTGGKNPKYGTYNINGVTELAHRITWSFFNKATIPVGMNICHRCDTPACVNPEHLFLGTPKDNTLDRISKGRIFNGEKANPSKLKENQVIEIKRAFLAGESSRKIAKRYGIAKSNVLHIFHGRTWAHINHPTEPS